MVFPTRGSEGCFGQRSGVGSRSQARLGRLSSREKELAGRGLGVPSRRFFSTRRCPLNIIPITDPLDSRLSPYRDLKRQAADRGDGYFIAEGRMVVQRLLASDYPTVSILAEPKRFDWLAGRVAAETPVYAVSAALIRAVVGFDFHRGLLACGRRIPFTPAAGLFSPRPTHHSLPSEVALAAIAISDRENLGSLIRTAAALGIDRIAIDRRTIDPLCRRVLRVSMGAALQIRWHDLADPLAWLSQNQRGGDWTTVAMTLAEDSIPLYEVGRITAATTRPTMIVLGNEGDGLPLDLQAACTVRASIPMSPTIDSLNVSVAGAIAIYELLRSN